MELHECPVSFISSESRELIDIYARARRGYEAFGVSFFGPDYSEWPIWAMNLTEWMEMERGFAEHAEEESERQK